MKVVAFMTDHRRMNAHLARSAVGAAIFSCLEVMKGQNMVKTLTTSRLRSMIGK